MTKTRKWRLVWMQLLVSSLILWVVYLNLIMVGGGTNSNESLERPNRSRHQKFGQTTPVGAGSFTPDLLWNNRKNSTYLPEWTKNYFDWHIAQRPRLDRGEDVPILVVRCLRDDKCGGTADRLKPLVLYIAVASKLNRLLLFYWERPCALEEFLVPPNGGVDWRLPSRLAHDPSWASSQHRIRVRDMEALLTSGEKSQHIQNLPTAGTLLFQSSTGGEEWYDQAAKAAGEPTYRQVYHDAWYSFFTPSPPVQDELRRIKSQLQLSSKYVAVHIRARYQKQMGEKQERFTAHNSVTCASRLRKSAQEDLFISGDSSQSIRMAVDFVKNEHSNVRIVSSSNATAGGTADHVLHLDRGTEFLARKAQEWSSHSPKEHFATFVDLYLLSEATCIAYNVGNFGKWANLLSKNPDCETNHAKHTCRWKEFSVVTATT